MGIKGELVRNVFLRNRSFKTHEKNTKNNNFVERKKWHTVRSYLCGDEYNSVLVEEDAASIRSSEATVTQPVEELEVSSTQKQEPAVEVLDLSSQLKRQVQAAFIIQSAFRSFLARRRDAEIKEMDNDSMKEIIEGIESPSRESLSTSIEVQTGNSEAFSVQDERIVFSNRVQQKSKTQLHKLKEEWDDSTVSSNVTKMRIQNRLEASTRRERALAYAFSQQLRICSKRKHSKSDVMEANMSWSWLERWMATRLPEGSSVETHTRKPSEVIENNHRLVISQRLLDISAEEKESCGSNEVSVRSVNFSADALKSTDSNLAKNRSKGSSDISRRKTVPSLHLDGDCTKVSKRDWVALAETERDKRSRQKQAGGRGEIKCNDAYINNFPSSSPVESRIGV
ncbi:protein IQ-DOMAIN 1 [Benincasa hispida]|uniref:protein IQ-DOMAIN 1 n=1 Tax=Benincasa hispida TaxID=102211 RepID=UPI001901ABDC|nr:protein IQ-DOMAIN 1 [Benincasa hispida]XP_038888591.1 protein IQ-DOMAIN 1 [Benincasa hispida]